MHCKKEAPFIRLNLSFRSDPAWWLLFCETWNGVSSYTSLIPSQPLNLSRLMLQALWAVGQFGLLNGFRAAGIKLGLMPILW